MGNFFSNLFHKDEGGSGGSSAAAKKQPAGAQASSITSADQAQLEVRRQRDRFMKVEKKILMEQEIWKAKAKEAVAQGKNEAAKQCLKIKKLKDDSLESLRNQLLTLEDMVMKIETQAQNQAFLSTIQQGTAMLKKLQEELPIERAQDILDDAAEAVAAQNEINDLIQGTSIIPVSESELLEELAALEGEMQAEKQKKAGAASVAAPATAAAAVTSVSATITGTATAATATASAAAPAPAAADHADLAAALPAVPTAAVETPAAPAEETKEEEEEEKPQGRVAVEA